MDIKPIETHYNGYRFRSRLEARWAVFFDAAGIKYEYEPEGYMLKDGTKYLPDFWLPDFDIFAEIKANQDLDDYKWARFAMQYANFEQDKVNGVICCYGDPSKDDIHFITECITVPKAKHRGFYEGDCRFIRRVSDNVVFLAMNDYCDNYTQFGVTENAWTIIWNPEVFTDLGNEKRAARQARFEYGETPNAR